MLKYIWVTILLGFFLVGCGDGGATNKDTSKNNPSKQNKQTQLTPQEIDDTVMEKFTEDNSTLSKRLSNNEKVLIGNWYGKESYANVRLQLKADGSYNYYSTIKIGKYQNFLRITQLSGKWSLQNSNTQLKLTRKDGEAPLILRNSFPTIEVPSGVLLKAGSGIDTTQTMQIDKSEDTITADYSAKAQEYLSKDVADFSVDYFTMVAPKTNTEAFWSSVDIKPMGYNYGHKLDYGSETWEYALKRTKNDPKNYVILISDESWQTFIGHRKNYTKDIKKPQKIYRWLEYFKDQMQILAKVEGTVLYNIAGDAPPFWAGDIRRNFQNDPKNVPAKLYESRFPEVYERNPSNSFGGIFQMMDYLRMKYAPNVKLGYTLKTWGIDTTPSSLFEEPNAGWDDTQGVQTMAEYINNFEAYFDFLSFNFNPRSKHDVKGYESGAKYFGAISKKLITRGGKEPKLWIWKLSLWNQEQVHFVFSHIDFLVDECNAIGVTLGHGNDLTKQSGFSDNNETKNYLRSWIKEYYSGDDLQLLENGTIGIKYWR